MALRAKKKAWADLYLHTTVLGAAPLVYLQPLCQPVVTSHADIERAAFRLFAQHGFEGTTLEAIAREVGVGRRTLFRYFESKNDIPWGQFDATLDHFRSILAATPTDLPVADALYWAVRQFN